MLIRTLTIESAPFKLNKTAAEIRNDKENINSGIFREYFRYQNPSFLAKDLLKANQIKNHEIVNQAFYSVNELRNPFIRKEIPENENRNKTICIVEKVLSFNTR